MRWRSGFPFLVFFILTIEASSAQAIIRIMPLGDSITTGNSSGVVESDFMISYRKDLYDLLSADRYELDFVGTLNDGSEAFGDINLADHEGHVGWRDDEIVNGRSTNPGAGALAQWLASEQPQIVLLHIGTNGLESNPDDVSDILDVIDIHERNFDEAVWVILALIINRVDYSSTTTAFNENVEAMANDRKFNSENPAFPDKIIIVDMEEGAGIDYRLYPTGDMWDELHPYATGYAKMAEVWYAGLLEILPRANAGVDQTEYEGNIVTLHASDSYDPEGLSLSFFWEQQVGGSPVSLSDPTAEAPFFTAPEVESCDERLTFKLTVTNEDGLESVDTTNVFVLDEECPYDPERPKTLPGVHLLLLAD